MVDGVHSEVQLNPQTNEEAGAKRAVDAELAKANALLDDHIKKINDDPTISAEDKRKLVAQLNDARGGNVSAIYNAINFVSAKAAEASANSSYEMIGNASAAQQNLMTGSFNIGTARGRHDFAQALAGPNASKEEVAAIADVIEHDPVARENATRFSRWTPEQRAEHKAYTEANKQRTQEVAQELEAKPNISAEDRNAIHQLSTGRHAKQSESVEALEEFQATGNSSALQSTVGTLNARFENFRRQSTASCRRNGAPNPEACGTAAAEDLYDLNAVVTSKKIEFARSFQARDKVAGKTHFDELTELTTGSKESRIEAFIRIQTAAHKGEDIDQTKLRASAVAYVDIHEAKRHAISRSEYFSIELEGLTAKRASTHNNDTEVQAYRDQVTENMSAFMAMSGYSKGYAKIAAAGVLLADSVKNAKTAVTTMSEGVADIIAGDKKGIDDAGHRVGLMAKKAAAAVGLSEHAQDIGHTATVVAQGAGHMIAGAVSSTAKIASNAVEGTKNLVASGWQAAQDLWNGTPAKPAAPTAAQKQQAEIAAARREADVNHDGKVSGNELSGFLARHGLNQQTAERDGKAGISNAELAAARHHQAPPKPNALQQAVARTQDTNHDGKVSAAELAAARKEADKDHNGKVSAAELGAYLRAHGVSVAQQGNQMPTLNTPARTPGKAAHSH